MAYVKWFSTNTGSRYFLQWLIVRQSQGVPNFLLIKMSKPGLLGYGVELGKVSTQSQMKSSPKSSPFLIRFFLLLKQKLTLRSFF